jgi:hypothetical protein
VFLSDNIETYGYNRLCSFIRAVSGIGPYRYFNFTIVAASDDFIKKTKPRVRALQARYFVVFLNPEDRTGDGESKIRALINHQNKTADTLPIVDTIFLNGIGRARFESKYWKVINSYFDRTIT